MNKLLAAVVPIVNVPIVHAAGTVGDVAVNAVVELSVADYGSVTVAPAVAIQIGTKLLGNVVAEPAPTK